jgi:hypothetical protein
VNSRATNERKSVRIRAISVVNHEERMRRAGTDLFVEPGGGKEAQCEVSF